MSNDSALSEGMRATCHACVVCGVFARSPALRARLGIVAPVRAASNAVHARLLVVTGSDKDKQSGGGGGQDLSAEELAAVVERSVVPNVVTCYTTRRDELGTSAWGAEGDVVRCFKLKTFVSPGAPELSATMTRVGEVLSVEDAKGTALWTADAPHVRVDGILWPKGASYVHIVVTHVASGATDVLSTDTFKQLASTAPGPDPLPDEYETLCARVVQRCGADRAPKDKAEMSVVSVPKKKHDNGGKDKASRPGRGAPSLATSVTGSKSTLVAPEGDRRSDSQVAHLLRSEFAKLSDNLDTLKSDVTGQLTSISGALRGKPGKESKQGLVDVIKRLDTNVTKIVASDHNRKGGKGCKGSAVADPLTLDQLTAALQPVLTSAAMMTPLATTLDSIVVRLDNMTRTLNEMNVRTSGPSAYAQHVAAAHAMPSAPTYLPRFDGTYTYTHAPLQQQTFAQTPPATIAT